MRPILTVFCVVLTASIGWAAPPKLIIPSEVKPTGQYAVVQPETDAASVLYIGLDGLEPFPAVLLADKRSFVLDTYGKKAGRYRFAAIGASKEGEQTRADFTLIIGTPPEPPPDNPPPDNPPGQPTAALYFAIVRADNQPATPEFSKIMKFEGWNELRKAGHLVKDFELSGARKLGMTVPEGTPLPVVLTLKRSKAGTWDQLYLNGKPWYRPIPTTNDGILKLTEGVAP